MEISARLRWLAVRGPHRDLLYWFDADKKEIGYSVAGFPNGITRNTAGRLWSQEMLDRMEWMEVTHALRDRYGIPHPENEDQDPLAPSHSPRDYPQDSHLENGNYRNECCHCRGCLCLGLMDQGQRRQRGDLRFPLPGSRPHL